jgi:hypothetical protein
MPKGYGLTPEQRSMRASLASHARWADEDGKAQGKRGQQGLRAKFLRETRAKFPNLDVFEIQKRADHALKAHMMRLALKASKAKQAKRGGE